MKLITKLCTILFFGVLLGTNLKSQQLPLYSQYAMNGFLINPAIAGSEGYSSINLTAREQWLGVPNAPKTHAISGQTRLLRNSFISRSASLKKRRRMSSRSGRVGLGVHLFNDRTGLIDRTGVQFTYSYHIMLNDAQLSFGLSVNAYQFRLDVDKMILADDTDILIDGNRKTLYIPDANFGIMYQTPDYYIGFSASELSQSALQLGDKEVDYKMLRHYQLMGGYKFEIDRDFSVEPTILAKLPELHKIQADLGGRVYYKNEYWGGLSYRTGNSLVFSMGMKVDKFYFGYAFDYSLNSLMKYSYGTHEFMGAIKFGDNARRYRWLNRF